MYDNIGDKSHRNIEVLVSAMNLIDTSIFENSNIRSSALIINQCNCNDYVELRSKYGIIRSISTTERGLSKSRNLAISKAQGRYCLICDDDEILQKDYCKKIAEAFEKYPSAGIICFKIKYGDKKFSDKSYKVNFINSLRISSPQMVLNMDVIRKNKVHFDENFGSGTKLGSGEENIFLYDCLKKGIEIIYVPELIAKIKKGESHWFNGYNDTYFYNRGIIIRRLMGKYIGTLYCLYFIITKYHLYRNDNKMLNSLKYIIKGVNTQI